MLSGGLAERSSAEEQTKRIPDQFTGTRWENKLLQGLHDTKMKMKEPSAPIYTFWICSEISVRALFLCVWYECATSIQLKVSTNKKIVVKNCFILAAGNGGRERAWRKNSAENIRGWKNPFVLWLPTANPALLYCTKIVSEKFTEM